MRRFAITAALASIALVATGGVIAVSANAVGTAPTTRLITKADLKPFGGAKKPVKLTFSIDELTTDEVNAVCINAKGQPLTFPDAGGWAAGGQVKGKRYQSVDELVRDYGTTQAQAAAWNALTSAIAGCAPIARQETTPGNPGEYAVVTQTQQTIADGLGILAVSKTVSTDNSVNGFSTASYTIFRQAGTAIIETVLYRNPGKTVTPKQVTTLTNLSTTLSTRWASATPVATPSASASASASPTPSSASFPASPSPSSSR